MKKKQMELTTMVVLIVALIVATAWWISTLVFMLGVIVFLSRREKSPRPNAFYNEFIIMHRTILRNIARLLDYNLHDRSTQELHTYVRACDLVFEQMESYFVVESEMIIPKLSLDCAIEFMECMRPRQEVQLQMTKMKILIRRMTSSKAQYNIDEYYTVQRSFHKMRDMLEQVYEKEQDVVTTSVLNEYYTDDQQEKLAKCVANKTLTHVACPDMYISLLLLSMDPQEREYFSYQIPWFIKTVLVPFIWNKAYSRYIPIFTEHVHISTSA